MIFTQEKDLNSFQRAALREGSVPVQSRNWQTLSIIATVALDMLSNPKYGREGFSITKVQIRIAELHEQGLVERKFSIGTLYNFFEKPEDLLDFLWAWRSQSVFTPLPVMPTHMVDFLSAYAQGVEDGRATQRALSVA